MHTQRRSIAENHFYIAGFGKVGKTTAHVLASLGATVTIVARSDTTRGSGCNRLSDERLTETGYDNRRESCKYDSRKMACCSGKAQTSHL